MISSACSAMSVSDPLGGAYFFNSTRWRTILLTTGFTPLLSKGDFDGGPYAINDVAAGTGGALYVATEDGIYVWEKGADRPAPGDV